MDWARIIEVLITSITSIIVALVGAGFFRRMSDRQKKNESKVKLLEQIKRDEIVHLAIREIRRTYNADRVYIWQFHNGGNFYTTSPIQKLSITYERCSDGLERKAEKNQNMLITNFTEYIKDVIDYKMFYSDINEMDDIGLRTLAQSNGTRSHAAIPVLDRDQHLVAILALDWVFSPIPQEFLKKDNQFNESFKEDFSDSIHSLDKYL
jgi:hypothetical protein